MNDKFFRYILDESNMSTKDLSEKLGITQQCLNKRIKNNKLYISDIFDILDILGLEFNQVFKRKEGFYHVG